jgi:hypothetical protein
MEKKMKTQTKKCEYFELDDDYLYEFENKKKAKYALLKLIHDFSGGKFCK